MKEQPPILLEVTRNHQVEMYHCASIAMANANGELLFHLGDPEAKPFTRSSMKPFQALPFVEEWKDEITLEEIAIAAASHSGEIFHRRAVAKILDRFNGSMNLLQCGIHPPLDKEVRRDLEREGKTPDVLHHNCSGKHAAMLATAFKKKETLEGYYELHHPVQQRILSRIARFCDEKMNEIETGMDGCSVVTFGPTLRGMATAFARLAENTTRFGKELSRIRDAMLTLPEYIAGTHERIDTDLMKAAKGLIAKAGAAGYYTVGWHDQATNTGVGVAFKVWSGDQSARDAIVVILLEALGLLPENWGSKSGWGARTLKNWAGRTVGVIRPSHIYKQALSQLNSPVRYEL
ncbi:MAG: asparaginase [bacterium]|nr:asparaginase [bacterium]